VDRPCALPPLSYLEHQQEAAVDKHYASDCMILVLHSCAQDRTTGTVARSMRRIARGNAQAEKRGTSVRYIELYMKRRWGRLCCASIHKTRDWRADRQRATGRAGCVNLQKQHAFDGIG